MRTTYYLAAALAAATSPIAAAFGQTGNGAPSGTHYNLNIIGVSHNKNPSMNQAAGNVIFVGLGSGDVTVTSKILLSPGDFQVLDKNGTDGVASFQLPADSTGAYTVWARALDRKSTRLNSSHVSISYAVFCLKKKIHLHVNVASTSMSPSTDQNCLRTSSPPAMHLR